jgi:nuclear transcription factor Y gamma
MHKLMYNQMISAEAPVLFAKAAEIFITEISLRAWIHTEDNKRRTLQRNDIAMAITKYDQFDFLIDIVPRDELKPTKRQENDGLRTGMTTTAAVHPDQVQYYFQLAQQHQAALQQQGPQQAAQQIQILQTGATPAGQQFTLNPQLVQVQMPTNANAAGDGQTVAPQQTTQVLQIAQNPNAGNPAQKTGQIQIVQNVLNSNGEVVQQQIPIQLTSQQIQALLQSQTAGPTQASQPIILTSPLQQTAVQMPQYQIATNAGTQFLQTVVSGAATNVSLAGHQTDINSSPQLEDESNET